MLISAACLAAAFTLSLFVRDTATPFIASWLVFFYASLGTLLFTGHHRLNPEPMTRWLLGFLLWAAVSAFIIRVTSLSPFFFAVITAPVLYALALMRDDAARVLRYHVTAIGIPLALIALATVIDAANGRFTGWPMLNPNNLAALMAVGLVASFGLGRREHPGWQMLAAALVGLFGVALVSTGSRGAGLAAFVAVVAMTRSWLVAGGALLAVAVLFAGKLGWEGLIGTIDARLDLWRVSTHMLLESPWFGTGLGTWPKLYPFFIDHAQTTGGWFAHNDPLQFAVEMGLPAAVLFYGAVVSSGRRVNTGFFCLLTLIAHTHISFDLYVPACAVAGGVCLALWYTEESWTAPSSS